MERLAQGNDRIVAITAAMSVGTGLANFSRRFPDRFFDVGIAEEHAVIFAAGMAARSFLPVVAVYSTFAQRIVDYVIHDVCLQNLPVIFCLDRAGIVGDDGPTHHGLFDIALFRAVPGLVMMQPKDEPELAGMIAAAAAWKKPAMIRYPRGCGPGNPVPPEPAVIEFGKAEVITKGDAVQIWALGDMLPLAQRAAQKISKAGFKTGVVNPRFIAPLDADLLRHQAARAQCIVTIENAVVNGGFGSAVQEALAGMDFRGKALRFGWPNIFIPHGAREILEEQHGLTEAAVSASILKALRQ